MFYNFYKDFDRDRLLREIGALTDRLVYLPIVSKSSPPMPTALRQLLNTCITSDSVDTDSLLAAFKEHESYIANLPPSIEECESAFIDQVVTVLNSFSASISDGSANFDYLAAFVDAEAFICLVSKLGLTVANVDNPHVTLWHSKKRDSASTSLFPLLHELIGQNASVTVRTFFSIRIFLFCSCPL
jgi:hypothetical protein